MASRPSAVVEIRSRDADRTREEILRAAMAEFAGHGFGGARMGAIAERSGVESWNAVWMPIAALLAPGPRVTKQMPGRPLSLPWASAM